jgi:uncharacterized membrane protein YhiD involved in acid resistance
MSVAFWALAFVILCQIIAFSFCLGRLSQHVSSLERQLTSGEETTKTYRKNERDQTASNFKEARDQTASNFKDARDQTASNFKDERELLTNQTHQVLPECQNSFLTLSAGLSRLDGKVDTLILMLGKKNG